MVSMSTTVCDDSNAGTDADVILKFKTSSNAVSIYDINDDFHNWCNTGILDKSDINDFEQGMTQVWDSKELGDCGDFRQGSFTFRPQEDLQVQVVVNRYGILYTSLKICNIRATFAFPFLTNGNKTHWEWKGRELIDGEGDWHQMEIN